MQEEPGGVNDPMRCGILRWSVTVTAWLAMASFTLPAAQMTIQNDESVAMDTVILFGSDSNEAGSWDYLMIRFESHAETWRLSQSLIKYDLTPLAGKTITGATYYVYLHPTGAGWNDRGTWYFRRLLPAVSDWVESPANNRTTWDWLNLNTARWPGDVGGDGGTDAGCTAPGVDYASGTALGSVVIGDVDRSAGYEFAVPFDASELAALVADNHGFKAYSIGAVGGNYVYSSNTSTPSYRPKLIVSYTGDTTSPAAVTDLAGTAGSADGSIRLTWTTPGDDGTTGRLYAPARFAVQRSTWSGVSFSTASSDTIFISTTEIAALSAQSYTLTGLSNGVTYYLRVWTADPAGNWSSVSNGATQYAAGVGVFNSAPNAPTGQQCESQTNPLGIRIFTPTLSWVFSDPDAGDSQSAFRVILADNQTDIDADNGSTWDTGKTSSSGGSVTYAGPPLRFGATYYWKVRTWDAADAAGPYAPAATFSMMAEPPAWDFDTAAIKATAVGACGSTRDLGDGAIEHHTAGWGPCAVSLSSADIGFIAQDLCPPAQITSLSAVFFSTAGTVNLSWTAPGDDGTARTLGAVISAATAYFHIQYTSVPATVVWSTANAQVVLATAAVMPGSGRMHVLSFTAEATYYLRLWTRDGTGNLSLMSVGTTVLFAIPPSAVDDLGAQASRWGRAVELTWTAPGDDGTTGDIIAGAYRIRYSTAPGSGNEYWGSGDWNDPLNRYEIVWSTDAPARAAQSRRVSALADGATYYFRLWSTDETGYWSPISNGATAWATQGILSVSVVEVLPATTSYDYGSMGVNSSSIAARVVVVQNTGNLPVDLGLSISTEALSAAGTVWTVDFSTYSGLNRFVLEGVFDDPNASNTDADFGTSAGSSEDVIGPSVRWADAAAYAPATVTDGYRGDGVPPFEDDADDRRHLRLRLTTPLQTSTTAQQYIPVSFTAKEQ